MTRVTVDAKFFPHIIDEIFAHASSSTLLALRVNREWRKRAERKVAYHVCVTETIADSDFLPRATTVVQSPEEEFPGVLGPGSPDLSAPSFLSSAAVVDVNLPKFDRKVACTLKHCSQDAVLRCFKLCYFTAPAKVTPKVYRVVLFCSDPPRRFPANGPYVSEYRLHRIPGPKHVVIHLRCADRRDPAFLPTFATALAN